MCPFKSDMQAAGMPAVDTYENAAAFKDTDTVSFDKPSLIHA